MTEIECDVHWRARGVYLPNNSSKAGLLDETRAFLLTYGQLGDLTETRRSLIDGGLVQRSRATRVTILRTIQERLTRWSPPAWVMEDLVMFARDSSAPSLPAA